MNISPDILKKVGEDPIEGAIELCRFALGFAKGSDEWNEDIHSVLLEATAVLISLEEHGLLQTDSSHPEIEGHMGYVCNQMLRFVDDCLNNLVGHSTAKRLEALKKNFSINLANGFAYEFTDGDINRIQELINELRNMLTSDSALDEGHKRRLLKRLEDLQKELHKRVSNLSNFYNLLGDFGVVIGKLGKDAKPFTDRIGEIMGYAWKSQARAEQLPSNAENPMLEQDKNTPRLQ